MSFMDQESLLNDRNQRVIKLTALFNGGGWKLFEEELKEIKSCTLLEIEDLTRNPVVELEKLNLAICRRNALDVVFNKIAELQEELEESAISPDEA